MQTPPTSHKQHASDVDTLDHLFDTSLAPLFWRPDRIDALSAWCGHIPFAHWLITALRPQCIVELGTHTGVSYSAFCTAVERNQLNTRCYAIDTWRGDQHTGEYSERIFTDLQAYNQQRFSAFSTLIRATFNDAIAQFPDASIDLLHIDGLHTYEAVEHDFKLWQAKLRPRAVVLFHDTNERQQDFGVWRLWSELRNLHPSFEFLHGHGLGLLAIGSELAPQVQHLCNLTSDQIATVRSRFALLGERWEAEQREHWSKLTHEGNLAKAQARIEAIENARADLEDQLEHALAEAELRASAAQNALKQIESSIAWRLARPMHALIARAAPGHLAAKLRTQGVSLVDRLPSGLGARVRLQDDIRVIEKSPLFDAKWYAERYPEAAATGVNPAHHYARTGAAERKHPGPQFDADWYLRQNPDVAAHGINPLVHFEKSGRAEGRSTRAVEDTQAIEPDQPSFPAPPSDWEPSSPRPNLHNLLAERFAPLAPLKVFRVAGEAPHITLITDSVDDSTLVGDPRTGIAFAATLAKRDGVGLRIVTRFAPADATEVGRLLKRNGIEWERNIDFVHLPISDAQELALGADDLLVTTSWWITQSVVQVVDPGRVIYLIQEDESALYASGDERVRCIETTNTPGLNYVVDSQLLFEHLCSVEALRDSIGSRGRWFEPAFPAARGTERATLTAGSKRQFFFYARPDQVRYLYWRGLETIGACIEEGILDPQQWDFHFIGQKLTPIALPGNAIARFHESPSADDYLRLVDSSDLALCLLDSPHPGYAALDLAASGALVVTNQHGAKTSLQRYSDNIVCVDRSVASLKEAIRAAVHRVPGQPLNHGLVQSNRSWDAALSAINSRIALPDTEGRRHV
jgi:hypothetical protein